jgi:bifunctional non-homologous end joining protein LigD
VEERDVTFLKPKLVAQVSFSEWTKDGKLRHPLYLGLRDDKKASEIRREA